MRWCRRNAGRASAVAERRGRRTGTRREAAGFETCGDFIRRTGWCGRRGGRPGRVRRPAAHPGPGPAVRDRLRRASAGAAHLPGAAGGRARRSWSCRGWSCRRAGLAGGGLGLDIVAGTRQKTRTRWSPAARPGQSVGLADRMWALMVLRLRDALPGARQGLASAALRDLRIRQDPGRGGGAARGRRGDRPGARAGAGLAAAGPDRAGGGRGHRGAIVGRGPRPVRLHDRRLRAERGQPAPRGLGPGAAPRATWSSWTSAGPCPAATARTAPGRTSIGEPPPEFAEYYQVLKDAQEAACAAVRPGVSAEAVDAAAREPITAAGYGEHFIHRTGHGIGLECHEDPYIVAGNAEPLEPGMAFSVEPGIYPGGARRPDRGHRGLHRAGLPPAEQRHPRARRG